jgi:hypothetical protein
MPGEFQKLQVFSNEEISIGTIPGVLRHSCKAQRTLQVTDKL